MPKFAMYAMPTIVVSHPRSRKEGIRNEKMAHRKMKTLLSGQR